jgi:hypothetical protein
MYSAIVKIWRSFMHTIAIAIFAVLVVAIAAAMLQTPVEIAEALGARWAHRVMVYFGE